MIKELSTQVNTQENTHQVTVAESLVLFGDRRCNFELLTKRMPGWTDKMFT